MVGLISFAVVYLLIGFFFAVFTYGDVDSMPLTFFLFTVFIWPTVVIASAIIAIAEAIKKFFHKKG